MSSLLLFMLFLVAQFVLVIDALLFGQPKLECKRCICHPECHCETKCVQQQIMKECNLGVDAHNAFASHYTQEHRTSRLILLFSLLINFLLTLLLLFRKPVRNWYRAHQLQKRRQKQAKQQAAARQHTERHTIVLKGMIAPHVDQCSSTQHRPPSTSAQPLFQLLSNLNVEDRDRTFYNH